MVDCCALPSVQEQRLGRRWGRKEKRLRLHYFLVKCSFVMLDFQHEVQSFSLSPKRCALRRNAHCSVQNVFLLVEWHVFFSNKISRYIFVFASKTFQRHFDVQAFLLYLMRFVFQNVVCPLSQSCAYSSDNILLVILLLIFLPYLTFFLFFILTFDHARCLLCAVYRVTQWTIIEQCCWCCCCCICCCWWYRHTVQQLPPGQALRLGAREWGVDAFSTVSAFYFFHPVLACSLMLDNCGQ